MKQRLRRNVVGLACLSVAVLVGLGAIADHKWKNMRSNRAELAEWYCEHQGNQCGGASSEGIEARWNERERAYVIAISVLGSVGVGLLGARRLRPQR